MKGTKFVVAALLIAGLSGSMAAAMTYDRVWDAMGNGPFNRSVTVESAAVMTGSLETTDFFDAPTSYKVSFVPQGGKVGVGYMLANFMFTSVNDITGYPRMKVFFKGDGTTNTIRFLLKEQDGEYWISNKSYSLSNFSSWQEADFNFADFTFYQPPFGAVNDHVLSLNKITGYAIQITGSAVPSNGRAAYFDSITLGYPIPGLSISKTQLMQTGLSHGALTRETIVIQNTSEVTYDFIITGTNYPSGIAISTQEVDNFAPGQKVTLEVVCDPKNLIPTVIGETYNIWRKDDPYDYVYGLLGSVNVNYTVIAPPTLVFEGTSAYFEIRQKEQQTFVLSLKNSGNLPTNWSITPDPAIKISPSSGSLGAGNNISLIVTVEAGMLSPGTRSFVLNAVGDQNAISASYPIDVKIKAYMLYPHVDRITPQPALPGTTVVLEGTDFFNSGVNMGVLMVSGQLNIVMPTDWSNGAINYHIPPYFTKGSYPIMVWAITDDGVRLSNLVTLEVGDSTTVVVTPIVTAESITDPFLYSVSPHVAVGGSIMTIQGSNFGDSPNTSVINFGGFALSNPLSWSDNEISFKIPDNAAQGDYPIQVMKRKISGAQVLESASNSLQMTVRVFSTAARTYPNPFDPNQGPIILEIVTTLAGMGNVEIYDLTGRKIWALTANLNSGVNNLSWDGRDYSGNIVSDGIYLLRVVNGSQLVAKAKILVVKR